MHCALLEPSTVLFHQRFEPGAVVNALARASVFMGVPTHYVRLLDDADFTARACAGVRVFISGSAPLRRETFETFEARTGQRILERYGMTEAGMITSNPLDGARIAGTVGFALPGVTLRVVDEAGCVMEREGIGTLQIRGPNVFSGYWRKPEKTREDFHDGWFVTGDLVTQGADGRVSIVGRGKDLIISGGLNVYPKEVEQILDGEPGVSESAVFGVMHPDFGEGVVAAVVGDGSAVFEEAALRARLRETLAAFKVPQRIVEVAVLPRNAMGKVQKNLLRDRYADLFA
jgi:malonyl-CoA/methylmalonyl-CoA synthetase